MNTIRKTIFINVPREKVWDTMLSEDTYRQWSGAFHEGSYYKGSWDEGSKILFLGPNEDGTEGGMASIVKENRLHEFISVQPVAEIKQGIEDSESDSAKQWLGGRENYTFADKDGGTELTIEMDVPESYEEMMEKMWDKALAKLKEISE